jgi:hypothetical protein
VLHVLEDLGLLVLELRRADEPGVEQLLRLLEPLGRVVGRGRCRRGGGPGAAGAVGGRNVGLAVNGDVEVGT